MDTTLEGLYRSLDVTENTEMMLLSAWGTERRFHFTPQMCALIKGAFKPDTLWWSDMNQLDQTPKWGIRHYLETCTSVMHQTPAGVTSNTLWSEKQ